jgi:histone H3/H4
MAEIFSNAPFKRLLQTHGARVGDDAAVSLAELTEEIGFVLIEEAQKAAEAKKRKTIRKEDVREAKKKLW